MDEYIEREKIVFGVLGLTIVDPAVAAYADAVLHQVQSVPAADVAPVVRCEDCKHLCVLNRKDIYAFCPKTNIAFLPFEQDTRTFFCSYGERKDGGNADENRDPEN